MTKIVTSVRHKDNDYGTTVVLIETDDVITVSQADLPAVKLTFRNGTSLVCLGTPEDFPVREVDV